MILSSYGKSSKIRIEAYLAVFNHHVSRLQMEVEAIGVEAEAVDKTTAPTSLVLSINLDQSMLKNAYFLEKSPQRPVLRPRTPVGLRRLGDPPPNPRVVTLTCYYNFVKFVSSVKCVSLFSKMDKMTPVHLLLLLLSHFSTYFLLQTL